MKSGGWEPVKLAGYLFLPLALLAVYKDNPTLVISLWVFFFIAFAFFPVFFYTKVKYWEAALSFWGVIYTGGLLSILVVIRLLPAGFFLTLFLFIMVWSADILAYFVGGMLGKNPLAPHISPKKTVEGTIGVYWEAAWPAYCCPGFSPGFFKFVLWRVARFTGWLGWNPGRLKPVCLKKKCKCQRFGGSFTRTRWDTGPFRQPFVCCTFFLYFCSLFNLYSRVRLVNLIFNGNCCLFYS